MKRRILGALLVAVLGALPAAPAPVHAQWGWNAYGGSEFDSDDLVFVLGGFSLAPTRDGWVPVGSLQAYWLRYGESPSETKVTAVTPSIGLRNNFGTGSFTALVGYTFADADREGFFSPVGNAGDGVVNSLALDYWGTGNVYLQGLGSYNYGAESLWARGRAMVRLFGAGAGGSVMGGGEVAYLNVAGQGTDESLSSLQPGIVLGYNPGGGTSINVGVGRRLGDLDATYFRVELSLTGR